MLILRRPPIWIGITAAAVLALTIAIIIWATTNSGRIVVRHTSTQTLVLWAWERPEDLRLINPQTTSVAFLAKTLYLRDDAVIVRPRLQPLQLSPGTKLIPVVRIESDRKTPPTLSETQIKSTVAEIKKLASYASVETVQIDFDATLSEREFYRAVLTELRSSLSPSTKLSITALGSWCVGDNWLDDLPIDEAVPMLFRMGIDRNAILSNLASEGFESKKCQTSAGISTDEPITELPAVSRFYVFNPRPWSIDDIQKVTETHKK
jgi:hypothetical protein